MKARVRPAKLRRNEKFKLPRKPSVAEAAWAAGIIDGEGCITIARRPGKRVLHYYSLFLKVTMCDLPTIERLVAIFGVGTIHIQNKRGERANDSWSWWISARRVEAVLRSVRPYLVTKAAEADLALEFMALPVTVGRFAVLEETLAERERLYIALRDANQRRDSGGRHE